MKRLGLSVIVALPVVVLVALIVGGSSVLADDSRCNASAIAMVNAPGDALRAAIQERVCSSPGIATTGVDDIVQILRADEPPTIGDPILPHDVLVVAAGGNPIGRPQLQWLSASKLQVIVPNRSLIGYRKASYGNIEIVLKFVPDDPADRAQFLKSLGLPPE